MVVDSGAGEGQQGAGTSCLRGELDREVWGWVLITQNLPGPNHITFLENETEVGGSHVTGLSFILCCSSPTSLCPAGLRVAAWSVLTAGMYPGRSHPGSAASVDRNCLPQLLYKVRWGARSGTPGWSRVPSFSGGHWWPSFPEILCFPQSRLLWFRLQVPTTLKEKLVLVSVLGESLCQERAATVETGTLRMKALSSMTGRWRVDVQSSGVTVKYHCHQTCESQPVPKPGPATTHPQ